MCLKAVSTLSLLELLYRLLGSPFISKIVQMVLDSKITKGAGLGFLGGKGLRMRDGQIGLVNLFPPRGSPLKSKIVSH